MDTPSFYIALFIHLTCLIMAFGSVMVIDTFGLLWLLKKVKLDFVNRVAAVTQRLIWIGWSGMVLSGLVLITSKGYIDNLTQIKVFFVILVGLNGIFLHLIKKSMERYAQQNDLPALIKFRIGLATTISQTGWWGAMFIGFIHRHWRHNIPWPEDPLLYMGIILGAVLLVGFAGETILNRKNA